MNAILLAIMLFALPAGTELKDGMNFKNVKSYATIYECKAAADALQKQIDSDEDIPKGMVLKAVCMKPVIGTPI